MAWACRPIGFVGTRQRAMASSMTDSSVSKSPNVIPDMGS
eukprot:CAMPEP_0178807706 /NCGR_PEP_ID=MMETSP0745-20121128/17092_1 /TAXON_ID=913974 /ORGANISM="Nitzschia punctata, Strain CCMP561" /LENGTH=39 /DNA_ID= /DNA_START= /DNA_END= /DNA_ORIENTATION=